ncbi:helix-turn-helix domain-containing protein [Lewinella sp. IMCC34191]|uniref:helix-turn-helix domain-containing protein n=1 Tax=Lewinella sp. IMCC34191 TaxID=2259172 RepID=UPI000E220953|nr:helix-turn-helix domain-containing protein [Lewinella sp. IMCC34191]
MILYLKNMVCDRCKLVTVATLERVGLHPVRAELGAVEIAEPALEPAVKARLREELQAVGFELLDDKRSRTVAGIKAAITRLVRERDNRLSGNLSDYLQRELRQDYGALSHLFSEVEGTTVEQYYIRQRIEMVKELLTYDELTLSEIAFRLHYSSVGYLSKQFKQVTGMTPTAFKRLRPTRRPLDEL